MGSKKASKAQLEKAGSIRIRACIEKDIAGVLALLRTCNFTYTIDKPKNYRHKIRKFPGNVIIAVDSRKRDRIVGVIQVTHDGWLSMISHLAVHPDYRKSGVGTELLFAAEKRLHSIGAIRGALLVWHDNPEIIGWYKKRGYRYYGTSFFMSKYYKTTKPGKMAKTN